MRLTCRARCSGTWTWTVCCRPARCPRANRPIFDPILSAWTLWATAAGCSWRQTFSRRYCQATPLQILQKSRTHESQWRSLNRAPRVHNAPTTRTRPKCLGNDALWVQRGWIADFRTGATASRRFYTWLISRKVKSILPPRESTHIVHLGWASWA